MNNLSSGLFRIGSLLGAVWLAGAVLEGAPPALKVSGNQLLTVEGRTIRLRGVNCAGLEFSNDGQGHILKTIQTAVSGWHANLIRLPLSQDRWFGRAEGQTDGGAAYRLLVRQAVDYCSEHNAYILLDLHWSDAGEWGRNIGQHHLPDENSLAFWKDLAPRTRDDPAVLFDLYNEPSGITWDQWLGGGVLTETDKASGTVLTYRSVGLQEILDAIRSTGARNVAVAGGINWSYEVGGIPQGRQLRDSTGAGVVYANHPYPHAFPGIGRETIDQWTGRIAAFAKRYPVIITEFGSMESKWAFPAGSNYGDERWNREMITVLEEHSWNWTAWDFHPSAWPCLVSDWDYTPTPHFGVWVKRALEANVRN
jgi:hypothetical protein